MNLEYLPPPADLAEFISAFYLFESDEAGLDDVERADIAQIRIHIQGSSQLHYADGRTEDVPSAALLGPRLAASRIVGRGDPAMKMFGMGLLPAGWALAVSKPAHSYADKAIPLADALGDGAHLFANRIAAASSLQEMADITIASSRDFYADKSPAPLWFIRAVDQWLEADLVPEIAKLEETTGLSRRQIERLCKEHYGAPPKYLIRKYRALRSASAIANGAGEWQDFIDEAYYDQPHFIREVKHFTGLTPGGIREAASRVSQLTFGRAKLAGSVKPLVSQT